MHTQHIIGNGTCVISCLVYIRCVFFLQWGGERFENVQKTAVRCTALPDIECYGNRTFFREGFPCIK